MGGHTSRTMGGMNASVSSHAAPSARILAVPSDSSRLPPAMGEACVDRHPSVPGARCARVAGAADAVARLSSIAGAVPGDAPHEERSVEGGRASLAGDLIRIPRQADPSRLRQRDSRGRARVSFGPLHAAGVILLLLVILSASITLLIRQSLNYAAAAASSSPSMSGRATAGSEASSSATAESGSRQNSASADESPALPGSGQPSDRAGSGQDPQSAEVAGSASGRGREATENPSAAGVPPWVDLNTASASELETVRGIGPVTARKIIDYRTSVRRFSSVDQLLEVPGIGVKTLDKLRSAVGVS